MPAATTANALRASRSIQSQSVIGWPVVGVVAHRRPVAFVLDVLVGDRPLDDQDERGVEPALGGVVPDLEELVAASIGQHAVVQVDLGQAGDGPHDDVLDARLGGGGDGDGVAVAAQPVRDPEDVDLLDGRLLLRLSPVGSLGCFGHDGLLLSAGTGCGIPHRAYLLRASWPILRQPPIRQIAPCVSAILANPRQLLARQHGHHPLAADQRAQHHHARDARPRPRR